jgi:hypothetical protein
MSLWHVLLLTFIFLLNPYIGIRFLVVNKISYSPGNSVCWYVMLHSACEYIKHISILTKWKSWEIKMSYVLSEIYTF